MIKYDKYLKHNHPFNSLTGDLMDSFREKMLVELLFMNMRHIFFNMFGKFVICSL